jgi:hypothetical protein
MTHTKDFTGLYPLYQYLGQIRKDIYSVLACSHTVDPYKYGKKNPENPQKYLKAVHGGIYL